MLPIALSQAEVEELFQYVEKKEGARLQIDLSTQTVAVPDGKVYKFSVDSFRKECLYRGLDDIGLTLIQESKITKFETGQKVEYPWLYTNK